MPFVWLCPGLGSGKINKQFSNGSKGAAHYRFHTLCSGPCWQPAGGSVLARIPKVWHRIRTVSPLRRMSTTIFEVTTHG